MPAIPQSTGDRNADSGSGDDPARTEYIMKAILPMISISSGGPVARV
jgi:hypothetical protein